MKFVLFILILLISCGDKSISPEEALSNKAINVFNGIWKFSGMRTNDVEILLNRTAIKNQYQLTSRAVPNQYSGNKDDWSYKDYYLGELFIQNTDKGIRYNFQVYNTGDHFIIYENSDSLYYYRWDLSIPPEEIFEKIRNL